MHSRVSGVAGGVLCSRYRKINKSSARLIIKNTGNLEEADITIDNNCVIAGHNSIGKSTITKILFSIIKGVNFGERIYEDFINRIKNHNEDEQKLEIIKLIQNYNLSPYDKSIIFIEKLKHGLYLKYIYKYLNSTLERNILRFGEDKGGFTFRHNNFELIVTFINKGIVQLEYKGMYEWFKDATLISSTEVLNYSNLISMADTSITEEFNNTKLVSAQDKDLIDKLLKNKTISSDTLVMFDEPEEGMHPEWQLEFIEKLFEIKIPFALTTHSPYIIQGVIYETMKNIKEVRYYTVEQFKDLGYAKSKEELRPLNIVKDLTNPILKVRGF